MKMIAQAALIGLAALGFAAQADAAMLVQSPDRSEGQIIQVYGGCGPFAHRGPYGGCRTGGQLGGYVRGRSCPAGFHIGPYGRRCQPNRF